ncbi:Uncharacterised protein [uncultured archaeon]|nr:Uncharacterised protein [uncultured archaeon]
MILLDLLESIFGGADNGGSINFILIVIHNIICFMKDYSLILNIKIHRQKNII